MSKRFMPLKTAKTLDTLWLCFLGGMGFVVLAIVFLVLSQFATAIIRAIADLFQP